MTVRKMYKKYYNLQKAGYETVTIAEVIKDLYNMVRDLDYKKYKRKE